MDEFNPETDGMSGIYYYTEGNTQAEFEAYKTAILNSGFVFDDTYVEEESGDVWYLYSKGEVYLDTVYYLAEGSYYVEVHVYTEEETSGGDDSGNTGGDSGNEGGDETLSALGMLLEEASTLAPGKTLFGDRTITGIVESIDEPYPTKGNGISFYLTDGEYSILVHRGKGDCASTLKVGDRVTVTGTVINYSFSSGDTVIEFQYPSLYLESSENDDTITNDGAGLPTDYDGVYDVDFKNGVDINDVTKQGAYLDGCPTTGNVRPLVIPVEFSDLTASSKGYDINKLKLAFNGPSDDLDYLSVKEYYYESSNEQLNLDFYVYENWFRPQYESTKYAEEYWEYKDGSQMLIGDQMIMDEALAYLSTIIDLSQFDSDGNGCIDAVILITTLEIAEDDFHWAYRYWNYYTDEDDYYYEYDGVSANDYLWASYQFLFEDENGGFDNKEAMNTYTFIHEFGHILGLDDYYNYNSNGEQPLDDADVMDSTYGDHNPFSKINLGWITTSRLVVATDSIELTLNDFSSTKDTIIIANNWNAELGAYQEYYILMYYTHKGLNSDGLYFANEGIVMYHVNASLRVSGEYKGVTHYDIYNTNSDLSHDYGTEFNLIELCKSSTNTYVHTVGSSSNSNLTDDNGNKISYRFTVDSLTDTSATLTFTKNN